MNRTGFRLFHLEAAGGWVCRYSVSIPSSLATCKHHIKLCKSLPVVERSSSDQFSESFCEHECAGFGFY